MFVFLNALLCLSTCSYAMELVPLSSDKKTTYATSDKTMKAMLLQYIPSLPKEIQGNIVAKVNGYCGEKNYQIPIKLAYKFDYEISELEQCCPCEVGNKNLTAFDLWRLPDERRKKIIERLKPSIISDSNVFLEQEQHEIIDMLPKDIQENLSIYVLKNDGESYVVRFAPLGIGVFTFSIGLVIGISDLVERPSGILKISSCIFCIGGPIVAFVLKKYGFTDKSVSTKVDY